MPVVFLARHGPSASAPRGLLTAAQFGDYLRGYDDAGLAATAAVPAGLRAAAARCDVVVHSPLRRAVETCGSSTRPAARHRRGRCGRNWSRRLSPRRPRSSWATGFQNILIARELRRRGWLGPRWPDHRHGVPTGYRHGVPTGYRHGVPTGYRRG